MCLVDRMLWTTHVGLYPGALMDLMNKDYVFYECKVLRQFMEEEGIYMSFKQALLFRKTPEYKMLWNVGTEFTVPPPPLPKVCPLPNTKNLTPYLIACLEQYRKYRSYKAAKTFKEAKDTSHKVSSF